jgi:hypothetical protein
LSGTRAATRELVFELERDADRYALQQAHEPAVPASAICKAATAALQGRCSASAAASWPAACGCCWKTPRTRAPTSGCSRSRPRWPRWS